MTERGVAVGVVCSDTGEGDTTLTCGSCLTDDVPLADCTTMACDHSFCNDCWKSHFMIQVRVVHSSHTVGLTYD
jgi:hypothetical protein